MAAKQFSYSIGAGSGYVIGAAPLRSKAVAAMALHVIGWRHVPAECATLDGAHRVYRRFARPLPPRFAANQTSELAVNALDAWLYGGKHAWRQYHDPRRPKKS